MMDGSASRGSTSTPHGVKRRADDDLRDDQRLAKRLSILNLGMRSPQDSLLFVYDLLIAAFLRAKWQSL